MTRCDVRSRRSRLLARNPLLDRYSLQGRSQQLTNHGDVVIPVIRHVELRAFSIRIQHADLYHRFLLLVGMRVPTATREALGLSPLVEAGLFAERTVEAM